ncbi:hypothetical protein Adt_44208 [Abeliophyllum distichum]|uniref:Uncharacterized protein n=1 Tax=Abeliophyllum distichum TaxID=126358 RepID=A0ABD1PA67_9LAMI
MGGYWYNLGIRFWLRSWWWKLEAAEFGGNCWRRRSLHWRKSFTFYSYKTLPYHYYQDEGLYIVPHSSTLNLLPPSIVENQPLSFQQSPSHQPIFVTRENSLLSAPIVTLPYHLYREDGASGGAVTPKPLCLWRNSLQSS